MYVATSKRTHKKWELKELDDLLYTVDIENTINRRKKTEDELVIYKTDEFGAIDNEYLVKLPTDMDVEEMFKENKDTSEKAVKKEEENINMKDVNVDELSEDEHEVFNKMFGNTKVDIKVDPKTKQKEIREKMLRDVEEEKATLKIAEVEQKQQEEYYEKQDNEIHSVQAKQPRNYDREYQMPVGNYNNNQPTIYEATTIIPTSELKAEFKQRVGGELSKIEQQIYQLERQAREYKQLLLAIDNIDY